MKLSPRHFHPTELRWHKQWVAPILVQDHFVFNYFFGILRGAGQELSKRIPPLAGTEGVTEDLTPR
jgi:hypothetical protein